MIDFAWETLAANTKSPSRSSPRCPRGGSLTRPLRRRGDSAWPWPRFLKFCNILFLSCVRGVYRTNIKGIQCLRCRRGLFFCHRHCLCRVQARGLLLVHLDLLGFRTFRFQLFVYFLFLKLGGFGYRLEFLRQPLPWHDAAAKLLGRGRQDALRCRPHRVELLGQPRVWEGLRSGSRRTLLDGEGLVAASEDRLRAHVAWLGRRVVAASEVLENFVALGGGAVVVAAVALASSGLCFSASAIRTGTESASTAACGITRMRHQPTNSAAFTPQGRSKESV